MQKQKQTQYNRFTYSSIIFHCSYSWLSSIANNSDKYTRRTYSRRTTYSYKNLTPAETYSYKLLPV